MATGWDFEAGNGGGQKQNFTKFPQGVTRIRVLDSAPNIRWSHWMPQFQRSVNCPGRGCPIDEIRRQQKANGEPYSYNMTKRFAMNIYNHDTNQAEIMEQGITFMEDLRDIMTELRESGKSLQDVILKVRRRGSNQNDTSYRIDVDVEEPLSAPEESALDAKVDLEEYFKPHTPEQILALLQVREGTLQDYQAKWTEIMSDGESEEATTNDEEIATEEDIEIR